MEVNPQINLFTRSICEAHTKVDMGYARKARYAREAGWWSGGGGGGGVAFPGGEAGDTASTLTSGICRFAVKARNARPPRTKDLQFRPFFV